MLYTVLYSQWILEGSFIVCLAMNSVRMDSWLNRTENFIHVEKKYIYIYNNYCSSLAKLCCVQLLSPGKNSGS